MTAPDLGVVGLSIEVWDQDPDEDDLIARCSVTADSSVLIGGVGLVDCGSARQLAMRFTAR